MRTQRKGFIMLITVLVFIAVFAYWFIAWQNNSILSTSLTYASEKIPESLSGLRIVQVSDLHNKRSFTKEDSDLPDKIREAAPDIIIVTGDLIDYHRTDVRAAVQFIESIVAIAPVYYVPGNHEAYSGVYGELSSLLKKAGVTVLYNESLRLQKEDAFITLAGAADVTFIGRKKSVQSNAAFAQSLSDLRAEAEGFTILLSHRPEYFDLYARQGFDLVFSGHAHGGQVRLPLIGGIYAPGQGFFPKYTSGMYAKDGTTMVVSRGLGNSEFPVRVFNRPEIVTVTLLSK
jgi:predicted MPP superfamily phosphohydrolase